MKAGADLGGRGCSPSLPVLRRDLTQIESLEGEIERLRGEVERHLHENSALKLELVHNSSIYTQN